MKEIKLTGISTRNKKHTVTLGNGYQKSFSNLKSAKRYLAQTGRWLTFRLHECNSLNTQLYGHYRTAWFYLQHNKQTMNRALIETEQQCQRAFSEITNTMDLIIDRGHFENGNHFVFAHFQAIFNSI